MSSYNPENNQDDIFLWLDANDITNGEGQPENNTTIEYWRDKSRNNYVFSNSDGSQLPIYKSAQATNLNNTLPSVYFDGTKTLNLLSGNIQAASGNANFGGLNYFPDSIHIFVVVSIPAQDTSGYVLFGNGENTGNIAFVKATDAGGTRNNFAYRDAKNDGRSSQINSLYPFLDSNNNPQDGIHECRARSTLTDYNHAKEYATFEVDAPISDSPRTDTSYSTEQKLFGSRSLKVVSHIESGSAANSSQSFAYFLTRSSSSNAPLSIPKAQEWIVSAYVYVDDVGSPNLSNSVTMRVYYYVNSAQGYVDVVANGSSLTVPSTGGWHRVWGRAEMDVATANQAQGCSLYINNNFFSGNGSVTMFVDGIQLEISRTTLGLNIPRQFKIPQGNDRVRVRTNGNITNSNTISPLFDEQYSLLLMSNNTGGDLKGYLREVIIFNKDLTDEESEKVQGYLNAKWQIDRLISTHPFSNNPPINTIRFGGANAYSPREPILFCELVLDYCDNKYASTSAPSTCLASGSDSDACFNTRATCQSNPNWRTDFNGKKIYRFVQEQGVGMDGLHESVPQCIISAKQAPVEITPTRGISVRASVSIKLRDFVSNDVGIDPYYSTRNYIASDKSTFFSKLLARNPYYVGRTIRLYYGYIDKNRNVQSYDGRKEYIIESFNLDKDVVTIKAKDPLTLGDSLKSKVPAPTQFELGADLSASHGSAHFLRLKFNGVLVGLSSTAAIEKMIEQFGANDSFGYIRINEEIIKYQVDTNGDGGSHAYPHLHILNTYRSQWGTVAEDHSEDDAVQACVNYGEYQNSATGVTINNVVYDLMTNFAKVPATLINNQSGGDNSWADESIKWQSSYKLNFIISEPREVNGLVNELGQMVGVNFYYDDTFNQVVMRTETPQLNANLIASVTDDHIIKDSIRISDASKQRISRVYYYYNQKNFTEETKKPKHYKNLQANIDSDAELEFEYDQEAIKTIFAYAVIESATASSMAQRTLARFRTTPKSVTFDLDASFATENEDGTLALITTGSHFDFQTKDIVDSYGDIVSNRMQCLSSHFDYVKQVYKIKALSIGSANYKPAILADANNPSADDAVFAERFYSTYLYISHGSGYVVNELVTFNASPFSPEKTGFQVKVNYVTTGITGFRIMNYGDGYAEGDILTADDGKGLSIRLTSISAATSVFPLPVEEPFLII